MRANFLSHIHQQHVTKSESLNCYSFLILEQRKVSVLYNSKSCKLATSKMEGKPEKDLRSETILYKIASSFLQLSLQFYTGEKYYHI